MEGDTLRIPRNVKVLSPKNIQCAKGTRNHRDRIRILSLTVMNKGWHPWAPPLILLLPSCEGSCRVGRQKRSRFITLFHAATKSLTNFISASSLA